MPPPPIPTSPRLGSVSSQLQSAASSAFSEATKLQALHLSGPNCWACQNLDPDLAHVVSQKDGQVCVLLPLTQFLQWLISSKASLWKQASLFPFSYKAVTNCIPLCPQCHRAFDRSEDPCYVFLPSDLQFFIKWETNDQQRRSQGISPSHRIVPGVEEYHNHQLSQNLISNDANGGLYCGYFLKDYLYNGCLPTDFIRTLAGPKPWHGHPLATIRRGIAILGSARCYVLGESTVNQLTTLRHLYFNDPIIVDQKLSGLYRTLPLAHKRKRDDDDTEDQDFNQRKRHASFVPGEHQQNPSNAARQSQKEDNGFREMQHRSRIDSECVFGPETTTEDKVRHFAPLLQSTDVVKLLSKE